MHDIAVRTTDPGAVPGARPARARLALLFVFLSLAALVAVPAGVQSRVDAARQEVEEVSEPARTHVTRLQYSLSRGMSSLRGYLLTGEPEFLAAYRAAADGEQEGWAELEPLAERLGADVLERFAEMRTLSAQWHQRVEEDEVQLEQGRRSRETARVLTEQRLYDEVLRTATRLDSAIVSAAQGQRRQIRSIQRAGLLLTVLLGLLALGSAGVVARLGHQVRRLALEAERRRVQAERALARTAEASEGRVRLLRGVTHDVKNPLGAANGYAELLEMGLKGPLTPGQAQMVQGIRRSVDSALAIIGDLLDMARAETGALPVERREVDLRALVAEAVEDHQGAAQSGGHTLAPALPDGELRAHTDPVRVKQVLGNLLSNAIKYTPSPGSIGVELSIATERDGAPRAGRWAAIRVTDDGPGIPAHRQESIFEEFTRLHDASEVKGHGLGLAISRRIARILQGEVTVASTPGTGATFTLWLPVRTAGAEEEAHGGSHSLPAGRFLEQRPGALLEPMR